MFNNLKKRIQGGGASTPVRTFLVAGDQIRKEENDNLSKDSTNDAEQAGRDAKIPSDNVSDAKAASDAGSSSSIPHSETVASASTSVKPPVQSPLKVAVEQIKDHGYQNINVNEIEELAKTPDEGYVADVTTLGVTDLQDGYSKLQSRSNLYKNRLLQVISAYKEMGSEKEQLKVSLSRAEEKHRRQISELKEQIQLDSQAKRDLENNYSLMLDEKDETIQVLRMKIKLIKDESSADGKGPSPESKPQTDVADEPQLKEKVKRLETLLTKCKDTIKSNKERIQQLATDRDAMAKQAQEKMDELEKYKEQSSQRIADLQSELVRSQKEMTKPKSIEGGNAGQETAAAAAATAAAAAAAAEQVARLEDQNKLLEIKVAKLEKTGQEQLEKSREIIRQLKEQKHHLEDEVKQLQTLEPRSRSEATEQEPRNISESIREETEKALKYKIKELLEEIEKIKTESEEKLRETNSRHSSELTALQERLQFEHEKRINEIDTEHQQCLTEVATENEKQLAEVTKRMETEFGDKMDKQMALLELQRIDVEKMKSDNRELDEIRRRLVDLEQQTEQSHAELEAERQKGIQILEEKKGMEDRVRELEGTVDSQREVISKSETEIGCLKQDFLTKTDEFNLTVKNYEAEIERLRTEVECKVLTGLEKNVPEIPVSEVKSVPTSFENFQQDDKLGLLVDLSVEGEPKVQDEPKIKDEADVKDETKVEDESKLEGKLKEKHEPSSGVTSQIEMENLELKELNKSLTDALEVERMLSRGCQDEMEKMKADAAKQLGETNQRLTSSSEMIAQLEQRMNDAMERENQLNMELETAKIGNEQNLALRNEEIVSLQATINELKNSEQALRDTNTLQNERITLLQDTIDQLNNSEQALKEKIGSQSDEIKSLLETINQKGASEEALKEMEKENLALFGDKVSSLESENEELKNSRKTLEETVAAQSKSISSLETENEELKSSRITLEETVATRNKSISSLETENEELKSSRITLEETVATRNKSISSLETENEELKSSRITLEETVATRNKSISSLETENEELKSSRITLEETVATRNESISSLETENEELKSSRITLEETVATRNKSISSLETENKELKSSKITLEETVATRNKSISSLETENEELKSSQKTLEETVEAQSENIISFKGENEELRNSKQALEETVSSQNKNISLLEDDYEELKNSSKALEETLASQSVEISSLQETVVTLRATEQALKEENLLSQNEEVTALQGIINQLQSSEQVLKETNTSQKEDLKLLQIEYSELKTLEQTFKEKCASQREELSSLQAAVDELRSSEQALKDKNVSQSEELSLLQAAIDELRSSEQALKDKNVSQSGEISLLQAAIDKLISSEQALRETIVSQSEEMKSLQTLTDKLKVAEEVSKESHSQELTLQKEEIRLLQETVNENRISEQVLKQRLQDFEQKKIDRDLGKDVSVALTGVDPLYEESLTAQQRQVESSPIILQNRGLKNETLDYGISDYTEDSFKNSDLLEMSPVTLKQQSESDLFPSLDNVQKYTKKKQQKFQLQLEHQVRNGKEEITNACREQEIQDQLLVDTTDQQPRVEVTADSGRENKEVNGSLKTEDCSSNKRLLGEEIIQQDFDEDSQVLQEQLKTVEESETDGRKVKTLERDRLEHQTEVSLEIFSLREQVKHLKEEVVSLKEASSKPLLSSEIESYSQFDEEPSQKEQTAGLLRVICTKQEKRIKELEGEVENAVENYNAVNEKLSKLEQEKVEVGVNHDEETGLKLLEKENIMKELEQMKISKKHFEDELQDLKQEIETCTKINSTAKTRVQESTEEMINSGTEVSFEADAKVGSDAPERDSLHQNIHHQYENEFDQVRTNFEHEIETIKQERDSSAKFYETRIADLEQAGLMLQEDLTILMEKLNAVTKRCTVAEKTAEHYKLMAQENEDADLKSQFKLDVELETKQREEEIIRLKNELEERRIEGEIITKEKLKQTAEELLTCVPSAENVEEQSYDGKLKGMGTLDSSMESANVKLGSESHEGEVSAKFYEARIADLEQTGAMLQEDLTIVMEKLNAMTERHSQAEKAVEHYKQLAKGVEGRDLKSQCQEDLETELMQREGDIIQLKRELEEQRTESQKLSEKLMQAVEKEKLTRRLQTHLEEFEKCGAATVGSLEQWLDVNNERTSAGDMSRASRENVHVEHFKGGVEDVPGQHEVSGVMERQLNLLPFAPVPLQSVQADQSDGELVKIRSSSQLEEVPVSLKERYEKEFRKLKSDFKSELRQHALENNRLKELQKQLLHEVEVLKSSSQMSTTSDVKLYVTEPTELEYLRNILYKYMLGLETKTLAKVICTVVRFSPDQTMKVLEREDSKSKLLWVLLMMKTTTMMMAKMMMIIDVLVM